jgi:hypothetical protein
MDREVVATTVGDEMATSEESRRRRRRRGGRGRGRGARPEEGMEVQAGDVGVEIGAGDMEAEIAEYPDEVPTLPQHSGFGSVWDSQLGAAVSNRPGVGGGMFDDAYPDEGDEAEPDVPEYLIAERRRQEQRRGGRGARGGGYRSAIDRERFGSGTRSAFGRGPGRGGRPTRAPMPGRATQLAMEPIEQTPGGDPWSEVPPEVQELLRAELARRGGSPDQAAPAAPTRAQAAPTRAQSAPSEAPEAPAVGDEVPSKPPARSRRTRAAAGAATRKPAADAAPPEAAVADVVMKVEDPAPGTRTRRTRASTRTASTDGMPDASTTTPPGTAEAPARATRSRRTRGAGVETAGA